ncbi:hypothetical protein MCW82_07045 [Azospirillum doebereinerae]|uniref:hypothetical protein n=1 Tax=Azospirillum doebereinerae TaxID=92933 RepID=UPI001EE56E54|nr:hypothetical protein [Azospirillum doebereinerae]MCG5239523.1 hypothetical protein [Azospirillum doebereinerae]
MGMKVAAFDRGLRLFVQDCQPAEISRALATFARASRDAAIAEGVAAPTYRTIVDGTPDASEDRVRPDGKIVYEFDVWDGVIPYALAFARARSPRQSGAYAASWFAMVNGNPWAEGGNIPPGAEVIVVNDQPYHRKIHVGAMEMSVPPGIVEDLRQAVQRRFGRTLKAEVSFIQLVGGYVLKGRSRRHRKDSRAGQPLTYPALVMKARD